MDSKEFLDAVQDVHRIISDNWGSIPSFEGDYTGIWNHMGISTVYNSPFCSEQIACAMVQSEHPLVRELLERDMVYRDFDPAPLRDAQILQNLKIIDMGCGPWPTFARCARRLGAEVYTVDIIPVDEMDYVEKYFTEQDRAVEEQHHILLDLYEPTAIDQLVARTNGNFDLVTEAHLATDGGYVSPEIQKALLKSGGIHFKAGELFWRTK